MRFLLKDLDPKGIRTPPLPSGIRSDLWRTPDHHPWSDNEIMRNHKRLFFWSSISSVAALISETGAESCIAENGALCRDGDHDEPSPIETGPYRSWEEAPSSFEEFGHDNHESVCRLPIVTVEEWERGRYWEGEAPVLVKNVTDDWAALNHWTKCVCLGFLRALVFYHLFHVHTLTSILVKEKSSCADIPKVSDCFRVLFVLH